MSETEALMQLEARRCAAIGAGDAAVLEDMLSTDYVHVHGTGNIDDRQGFIGGILLNPREVRRGSIRVRIYGEMAILLGDQTNRRDNTEVTGILQQIAIKVDGTWRFVSAQMTFKPKLG